MSKLLRWSLSWVLCVAVIWTVPAWWCRRGADRWFAGEAGDHAKLANTAERRVVQSVTLEHFSTGSAQFDGEWLFGSYLTAGFGFCQLALQHPETRDENLRRAESCVDHLLAPRVREFDKQSWQGVDPIDALGSQQDHAAYLGYFNVLLSLLRLVDEHNRHAPLNDRITAHLLERVQASPILLLDSYPGEVYPVDNCAVIGSIALHARATGQDQSALIDRWTARCRAQWVDARSGVLIQAWNRHADAASDLPRGSGTALGLYFLSFADARLARDLYQGMCRSLDDELMGFGAFREYPRDLSGSGDIDSGPMVLGMGLSATGFGMAGARMFGDEPRFAKLFSSAVLAGAPAESAEEFHFTTGGPLGNGILFAMLTAIAPEQLPHRRTPP